jgi:hypothetical protein
MPGWRNNIGTYFLIAQGKVLPPNDFPNLNAVAGRLLDFQSYWVYTAQSFA